MYTRFMSTHLNKILSVHIIEDRCGKLKSVKKEKAILIYFVEF